MSLTSLAALLLAFFRAIPALERQWEAIAAAYVIERRKRFSAEFKEAIKKAMNESDQTGVEKAIGHDKHGEPSGVGVIVDGLPGLRDESDRGGAGVAK